MSKRFSHRPTPALLVAFSALFVALGGASYAARPVAEHSVARAAAAGPVTPSFTGHGVALVHTSSSSGVALPISGANSSAVVNHGMTISGTTSVSVPASGLYLLTLAGNCNGGATNSFLEVREGNGLAGNPVDLFVGFEGNPSLAGANTVHLAAGTKLNMIAGHGGIDTTCGATLGASLVSAD